MLDFFRRKSQSPFLQATVIIIALVFVFWGVGSYQKGGKSEAVSVNGESISLEQFKRANEREYESFRKQYGQDVPKQYIEDGSFRVRVIDGLVSRLLLTQGAQKMGIVVNDMEVQEKIQEMESLKQDGIFNLDRYNRLLAAIRQSASDFEASMRNDLLTSKVLERLGGFAAVTPKEVEDRYVYANSEIKLEYLSCRANTYKEKVEVTDEALASFFQDRQDNYKTDRQVKVRYLSFSYEELAKGIILSDEEVQDDYDENRSQYDLPEKRRARHILIKTNGISDPEQIAEKRKMAEDLLARLRKGEDFGAMAKEISEDGSASKGGDLGFFPRGQMVKPFEDAAFSLQAGELSEVVETQFGFHVIKVDEIQEAHLKGLDEVRAEIEKRLKEKKGKALAFTKANEAYEQIILAGSLEKYGFQSDVSLDATDFFTNRNPDDAFSGRGKLLSAVFKLKKGELSSLVGGKKEYAILFLADELPAKVPALETVREKVEKNFIDYKARKNALEDSKAILAALKEGSDMATQAEKYVVAIKETDFFDRLDDAPRGLPKEFGTMGFALTPGNPYPEQVSKQFNVFYVYALKERKAADLSVLFVGKRQAIQEAVLGEKRQQVLAGWLQGLKVEADININPNLI